MCYFDETSVNSWMRKTKTFKGPYDNNVKMVMPKERHGGTTIYGCIANFMED
jgi:hypothetical protein